MCIDVLLCGTVFKMRRLNDASVGFMINAVTFSADAIDALLVTAPLRLLCVQFRPKDLMRTDGMLCPCMCTDQSKAKEALGLAVPVALGSFGNLSKSVRARVTTPFRSCAFH